LAGSVCHVSPVPPQKEMLIGVPFARSQMPARPGSEPLRFRTISTIPPPPARREAFDSNAHPQIAPFISLYKEKVFSFFLKERRAPISARRPRLSTESPFPHSKESLRVAGPFPTLPYLPRTLSFKAVALCPSSLHTSSFCFAQVKIFCFFLNPRSPPLRFRSPCLNTLG